MSEKATISLDFKRNLLNDFVSSFVGGLIRFSLGVVAIRNKKRTNEKTNEKGDKKQKKGSIIVIRGLS